MAAISGPAAAQPVDLTPKTVLKHALGSGLIGGLCGGVVGFLSSMDKGPYNLSVILSVSTACGAVSGALAGAVSRIAYLVLNTKDAHPKYSGLLGCIGATGAILSVIAMTSPSFPAKEMAILNQQLSIAVSFTLAGALGGIYSHAIGASFFGGAVGSSLGLFTAKMIGFSYPILGKIVEPGAVIGGIFGMVGIVTSLQD